jgi:hypothetical protein
MNGLAPNDWDGVDSEKVRDFVLTEMPRAVGDWRTQAAIFDIACTISDSDVRAEALSKLLVMPGHGHHQEITREIQLARYAYSVPYIRQMLESRFIFLQYTCSEHGVIAKWFGHALADIGTTEALAMIEEFTRSDDPEIADEMKYRLERLAELK